MILLLLIKKFGIFLKNYSQGKRLDDMEPWSQEMTPLLRSIFRKYIFLTSQEIRTNLLKQSLFLDLTQLKIYLTSLDKYERFKILKTLDFGKSGDLRTLRSFIQRLWMSIKSMMRFCLKGRSLRLVLKIELNNNRSHRIVSWLLSIKFDQVQDGLDKALLFWNVVMNRRRKLL